MRQKVRKVILDKSTDIDTSLADSHISTIIPLSPFQLGANVKSAYQTINEEMFNENRSSFLKSAGQISEEERKIFIAQLDKDCQPFLRRIFIVLDRIDDERKSTILGNLFQATIHGDIPTDGFQELSSIVSNIYFANLIFTFYRTEHTRPPMNFESEISHKALTSFGLLLEEIVTQAPRHGSGGLNINGIRYHVSKFEKYILDYGFKH